MDIVILVGSFTVVCLMGMPVAYALGIAAILGALYTGIPLEAVMLKVAGGMSVFTLLAIPFFIYAGDLMVRGGIAAASSRRLLVGHVRGGLGQVNIATATLFGGISGSAVAEAAAVGGLMIPQMKARGYRRRLCRQRYLDGRADRAADPAVAQHDHLFDLGRRKDLDRRSVHRRHPARPAARPVADGHGLCRRAPARLSRPSPSPASPSRRISLLSPSRACC